jgi:NitT/TauT family transport system permease protein
MAWVIAYSDKVRQALKKPANIGIDILVILGIAGLIVAVAIIFGHAAAPRPSGVIISLSFWKLPRYAFFSLSRGFIAYGLSLLFTLVYGTIAAHNRAAEKFMVPALDVLQSLPVLAFLPGLVLLFVNLFPNSWFGLEIACVIMIFTGQVWNMTFSYYGSVRSIPEPLREAGAIQHLTGWQNFRYLELPASMIGLVWNSMISMAGGWFFITINEAFTLNGVDYRLPGLGSYMNQAQVEWNVPAMIAGIITMILVIVLCDQIIWRPIVVWSQRFKLEETTSSEQPRSWMLQLLRRSRLLNLFHHYLMRRHQREMEAPAPQAISEEHGSPVADGLRVALRWLVVLVLLVLATWGAIKLADLLTRLPIHSRGDEKGWNTVVLALLASFGRTAAAVAIGALWTLPAGILIGLSPRWSNRLQPIVQILASFPAPMIYLMLCVLMTRLRIPFTFGSVLLLLLGTQWYTLFNVIAGAVAIPTDLREAGYVYHLSSWQRWRRIYIPAVFPFMATGLITAAGGAWNATIVAEYISVQGSGGHSTTYYTFGLGSLIDDATANGHFPLLAAAVTTMALAVVLINRFFWKRIYRLAEDRYSLNIQ